MATEAVLAELVARIKADTSSLDKALAELPGKVEKGTAKMAVAFGLASLAGNRLQSVIEGISFIEWSKGALESAGRFNDLSKQIDFTAASLVNLETLLIQNGSNLEQLTAAANILNASIGAAADGNQELIDKFDALGLSVDKLKALGPEQAFYAVTKALHDLNDATREADIGRDLLGRGYRSLKPTLDEVNGDLATTVGHMNDLNGPVVEEAIKHLDELGDRFDALGNRLRNNFLIGLSATIRGFEALASSPAVKTFLSALGDTSPAAFALSKGTGLIGQGMSAGRSPPAGNPFQDLGAQFTAALNPATGGNAALKARTSGVKELSQAEKDAQRIIDQTRTAQEKYDKEMGVATQLLDDHKIDLATWARYEQQLREELFKTGDAVDDNAKRVEVFAKIIKDHIGDAFESALFDAGSFADSLSKIIDGIARQIARTAFINPLSDSLSHMIASQVGSSGFSSFFSSLFGGARADGGPVSAGQAYLVGERGPEIFMPGSPGRIVANDNMGSRVHVTQIIQVQTGVAQTVRAEMMNLLPSFKQQAISGVAAEIQNGGSFQRLVKK